MDISSSRNIGNCDTYTDYIGMLEDRGCGCFAVCDASFSSQKSDDASIAVIDSFLDDFKMADGISSSTIDTLFKNADEKLRFVNKNPDVEANDIRLNASAALVLTDGSVMICGHIGNSRVYYLSENYLQYITPDHSLAYLDHQKGKFRFPGIRKSGKRRILTSFLGDEKPCSAEISEPVSVKSGDAVLICTDGFWEKVTERQVEKTLKKSKSSSEWLRRMLRIIKKNSDYDNYSAITIIF